MKYMCKCCDYSTEDKSNFNKHNSSRKHKLVESKSKVDMSGQSSVENYQFSNLVELVQTMYERLDKQEKQINEQKLQIDNIISEIF
jgi:hypothetical protein